MRISWLKTLLLVAISLPPDGLAAPCSGKRCSARSLFPREPAAAIPPIIPVPKPVVPVINPLPITPKPKPILPKPITPKPISPKPAEPAPPPGSALQCKRAPGDPCPNVATFNDDPGLEAIRNKGRIAQADLLVTQRANPPAQDVARVDVSARYEHDFAPNASPPLAGDERRFIFDNHLPIQYSEQSDWIMSGTRNKEPDPDLRPDDNILVTYANPGDRGIVITESFNKKYDNLKEPDRMRWSDMVMFDLENSFKHNNIKVDELQYMIRSNIEGGGSALNTRKYIDNAIKHTGGDRENVNTFRSDPYAPGMRPEELAAYQLLAGSDHVHRVILMLKDYPATLRNFRIESLSVTTDETVGAGETYNIVIKFTRVENA